MISAVRRIPTFRVRGRTVERAALGLIYVAAAICASSVLASGGDRAAENWTGELKRPGKKLLRASLVATRSDDGSIEFGELIVNKKHYALLSNVRPEKERIRFAWEPGDDPVSCDLKLKANGRFEGNCTNQGGDDIATLWVIPPPPKDMAAGAGAPPTEESEKTPAVGTPPAEVTE